MVELARRRQNNARLAILEIGFAEKNFLSNASQFKTRDFKFTRNRLTTLMRF